MHSGIWISGHMNLGLARMLVFCNTIVLDLKAKKYLTVLILCIKHGFVAGSKVCWNVERAPKKLRQWPSEKKRKIYFQFISMRKSLGSACARFFEDPVVILWQHTALRVNNSDFKLNKANLSIITVLSTVIIATKYQKLVIRHYFSIVWQEELLPGIPWKSRKKID